MERVAIPTANGNLSPHFGGSEYFTIFDIKDKKIVEESILPVPEHTTGSYPHFLADQKVDAIIVGGVGGKAIQIFNSRNINVFIGANVKRPNELIEDYILGKLALTGNLCNHEGDGHESHGDAHHHHN